ncbi:MAG: hypothetical protein JNM19_08065 [Chitinophagaceae bacterium]|nr:hypothetical protein [Chitinophagaceae bacterium]
MKRNIFTCLTAMLLAAATHAQVKLGNNPTSINSNAVLEIESTDKGLLVPRIALAASNSAAPLSAFVEGIVVYNTAIAGTSPNDVTPGFYVCDGTKWIATGNKLNPAELENINSPAGNYIGEMIYNTNAGSGLPTGPAYWNGSQWVSIAGSNIYNSDGTLSGNRIIVQGANTLTFTGTGNTIFNSGSVAVGTALPHASAKLDVTSTTQGFLPPRMTNAQMNAIASPADGLIIYCTDCSPAGWYGYSTAGGWQPFITTSSSSNGSARVSAWDCSGTLTGTLSQGTPASGVTKVVTATVTQTGTYNISATAGGVTFSASGTFAATGSQNVTLTASGTPVTSGTTSFSLNTSPNCSFNVPITGSSSGGTSAVANWTCSGAFTGTMIQGQAVSGVTKVVTANVSSAGTYSISATANGVTFSASGTFVATGSQNVTLTASGTPTAAGVHTYTINTTPNCNFSATTYGVIAKGDYIMVKRSTAQSVGSNTDIIYNTVVGGNIPYNTSTGVFTLTAGKVYRITFQGGFGGSSAFLVGVRLFDAATNTALYNSQFIRAKTTGQSLSAPARATYILAPTTNQTIKFQANTSNSGTNFWANSNVLIEELGITQTSTGTPTVDYGITRRITSLQTAGVNNDIIPNAAAIGNVPYNNSTGVFTLTAGKTYRLTSDLSFQGYSNSDGRLSYTWVDAGTNTPINNYRNMTADVSSSQDRTGVDFSDVIYTPASNQTVKLRVTWVGATGLTADVSTNYGAVTVQELGINSLGNTVQYAYAMRSTDQTGIGGNTNLVFDNLVVSNGIAYNTSTGVFTLTAGKTYRLSFGADFLSFSNNTSGYISTTWVDANTNTALVDMNALAYPATTTSNAFASNNVEIIYTPSTNQAIRLRTTGATGTATMNADNNYAIVQEIGHKVQ